ncbi:hypothetical protein Ancab_025520 [Ancistrocladus abbreviatus]
MATLTMRVLAMISMFICLTTVAHAAQGLAVYYNPSYTPSACLGGRDVGTLVAGVNDALWGNGAACGRKYKVTCIGAANEAPHPCKPNRFVIVQVVDYCRPVCNGDINLSRDAFNRIADLDAGKIRIQYDQVG